MNEAVHADLGTLALEHAQRVDFARLRAERLRRALDAMEKQGVDALVLGREGNARYVSGARRLWTAGTRPFGPGCVVVGATRRVWLLSTWDDGIPAEIPPEQLYGVTWNPARMAENLSRVEGLAAARRIGVDGMSTGFARMLSGLAPRAELVDGDALLRPVRACKTADEIVCLRTAARIAESALCAALEELRPGVAERALLGAFEQRMTSFGVTAPAMEGSFCEIPRSRPDGEAPLPRWLTGERAIDAGALVLLASGVLYAGYEGGLGRTWTCPRDREPSAAERQLGARGRALLERLLEVCRPGRPLTALLEAHHASGEAPPPFPIAHGLGLGYEPPVVGGPACSGALEGELAAGMVLSLQAWVSEPGVGGYLGREMVRIGEAGPELLTTLGHGPLAA